MTKQYFKSPKLSLNLESFPEYQIVKFNGIVDEDFFVTDFEIPVTKNIFIDFDKLTQINSCGIRQFILFMSKKFTDSRILYINCPAFLVYQMSLVAGFLSPVRKVKSFYAPYYSDESGVDTMVKFDLAKLGIPVGEIPQKLSTYTSPEGVKFEFDGFVDKFFQFLKLQ